MAKAQKGGAFERKICRRLSLWWTENARDDVFWRSAGSGGMATTRRRIGRSTYGQYGDVHACHPFGKPLLDVFTIELKRGYNRVTPMELLDRGSTASVGMFESFIQQVVTDQAAADTPYWLLIHKRDRIRSMVYFPMSVYMETDMLEGLLPAHIHIVVPDKNLNILGMPLDDFLELAKPDHIHDHARRINDDKKNNDQELSKTRGPDS